MKKIIPADRTKDITYAIRDVVVVADRYEAKGIEILPLNIGDPDKFDFYTPQRMINAVDKAMRDNFNGYVHSYGIEEAREAVAKEYERTGIRGVTKDDVIITAGVSEGMNFALSALVNPGDNVMSPAPEYPLYGGILAELGAKPNRYFTNEENGWQPDIDDIKSKINERTKGIIINNPNNPTGSLYSADTLKKIIGIADQKNLVVIADEIYNKIIYDGKKHVPIASLSGDAPVCTFGGLSKNYLVPGWRVGWIAFTGSKEKMEEYREAILKYARRRLCTNGPMQYAVKPALEGPHDHIQDMMKKLHERRDLVVGRLNAMKGFSCVKPEGAFYAFPRVDFDIGGDDKGFVLDFLDKKHTLVVHGTGFNYPKPDHFRIVFLPQPEVLNETLDRLGQYAKELYI